MNITHIHETGLPVIESATKVLHSKGAMIAHCKSGAERMMRRVVLAYPEGTTDLLSFLELADNTLADAAQLCGASVAQHEFALHKPSGGASRISTFPAGYDNLVPEGYNLVAEVDVVQNAQSVPHKLHSVLRPIILSYLSSDREYIASDIGLEQIVDSQNKLTVVDIEPVVAQKGRELIEIGF